LSVLLFAGPKLFGIPNGSDTDVYSQEAAKHFTIVFHTFVFLQIFNLFNARKIGQDEFNILRNLFNNPLFFIIQIIIIAG